MRQHHGTAAALAFLLALGSAPVIAAQAQDASPGKKAASAKAKPHAKAATAARQGAKPKAKPAKPAVGKAPSKPAVPKAVAKAAVPPKVVANAPGAAPLPPAQAYALPPLGPERFYPNGIPPLRPEFMHPLPAPAAVPATVQREAVIQQVAEDRRSWFSAPQ